MRTLLTAAAIISSAVGVGSAPISHSTYDSSFAQAGSAGANTQLTEEFASLDQQATPLPPEPWAKADPADSLYRLAREAMARGDYKRAAEIFHRIPERFPQSAYAGQAIYYEAYSLYRSGGDDDLSAARDRLKQLKQKDAKLWKNDGSVLATRVCGELAKRGDENCAAEIEQTAQQDAPAQGGRSCPDEDDENDDRIAALNALLQMDADRAMPILK
jgi:tetratricopeptide (TPR) repeat protein